MKKISTFHVTKGIVPYHGPLAKFGVRWLVDHTPAEAALRNCLKTATTEPAVQSVLEAAILVWIFFPSHTFINSTVSLGASFETNQPYTLPKMSLALPLPP
jgi:hypothetical protein